MFDVNTPTVKITLLAGGIVAALLVFLFGRRGRGPRAGDLGPISEQWMADQKRNSDVV
jgi:hypothetical protein